jgi:hypothetical protein
MKEKVVVLRELQQTIIYTNELNKQAMECHVSRAFIVYSVNKGARLTSFPFHRLCSPWISVVTTSKHIVEKCKISLVRKLLT